MILAKEKAVLSFTGLVFLFPLGMASIRHYSKSMFVAMILLGIWGTFSCREKLPKAQVIILYAMVAFLFSISLSFINTADLGEGFKQLGKMAYFLLLVPLYFIAGRVSSHLLDYFKWGLICAGPINLLIALYSVYFQQLTRAQGYYHPIVFGDLTFLGAVLLTVMIYADLSHSRLVTGVGTLSILSFLFACYLSGTRGAWIAAPIILAVALWLFKGRLSKKSLMQLVIGLALLVSVVFLFHKSVETSAQINVRGKDIVASTIENMVSYRRGENLNSSLGQRFLMWGISLEMFKEKPLIGKGLGGFEAEVERRQRENKTVLKDAWSHAHSIYFEFLGTTGILGFVAMVVSIFIVPALAFFKSLSGSESQRLSASAGLIFLASFAVFGITECWLYRSPMLISYIVCLLIFTTGCAEREVV